MVANVEVGRELGHIQVASNTIMDVDSIDSHPRNETVVVCTGSQGEPFSALSLISAGEHKFVSVDPGDTVILSATPIPGNESAVHRVINGLYKAGADVFHPGLAPVHVSGHAAADELAEMISLVRPSAFVPVHGEYRQLATHARIAEASGVDAGSIFMVEDGDTIELSSGRVTRGEQVQAGTVLVDGLGVGDVGPVVLRDRTTLARHGVVVCVVTIDGSSGEILAGPDVITRGFVFEEQSRPLLQDAADQVADALADLEYDGVTDWALIKKACRRALGEFVWSQTRRRPMIMPIVMEV
jgi:ribonuclease J